MAAYRPDLDIPRLSAASETLSRVRSIDAALSCASPGLVIVAHLLKELVAGHSQDS
jgi:hypothetical protein